MRFKELLGRLTGLSCPIFGISWSPGPSEVAAARRALAFLEDRRVLFAPDELEVPQRCVDSVLEIRRFLTAELGALTDAEGVADHIRGMRAACRKFLALVEREPPALVRNARSHGRWASWVFNGALGELRGVFGVHIAQLAARHGLDVEDDLATILPVHDSTHDQATV